MMHYKGIVVTNVNNEDSKKLCKSDVTSSLRIHENLNINEHDKEEENEITFETIDKEIFRIPDAKTRANTMQNYFFPRLQRWVRILGEEVRTVYNLDPYEYMTFAYRPAHRKDTKNVEDYREVYVGLTSGRGTEPLQVFHKNGTPFKYTPSYLVVVVDPEGVLRVSFRPYVYNVDQNFRRRLHATVADCWDILGPVMELAKISPKETTLWTPLRDTLLEPCHWTSPPLYFPLSESRGLRLSILPFVALFPLLDTSVRIARGRKTCLRALVERFRAWIEERSNADESNLDDTENVEESKPVDPPDLDLDLDSYRMIRAGKWYQILARDGFTCCACRRSGPEHGVVLHVDHIIPPSKGGTDDLTNLQTLCRKCNIGKSNRDATRLASV